MTKKHDFDDDILIDQPDIGCYYHGNMFRFPEEEMMRPQPPSKIQNMYNQNQNQSQNQPSGTMQPPSGPMQPLPMDEQAMQSPVLTNIGYTQAFLRTLIGRRVRISFLIGTSLLLDRVGTLSEVGISYVVLRQDEANTEVMADLYAIKFVDIFPR